MDFFILGALIFLNGLFSMSEIALVSARKGRLESLSDKGDKKAQLALKLSASRTFFIGRANRYYPDLDRYRGVFG
jgi:putative hemolysin